MRVVLKKVNKGFEAQDVALLSEPRDYAQHHIRNHGIFPELFPFVNI
jgi:hypothetical protein